MIFSYYISSTNKTWLSQYMFSLIYLSTVISPFPYVIFPFMSPFLFPQCVFHDQFIYDYTPSPMLLSLINIYFQKNSPCFPMFSMINLYIWLSPLPLCYFPLYQYLISNPLSPFPPIFFNDPSFYQHIMLCFIMNHHNKSPVYYNTMIENQQNVHRL